MFQKATRSLALFKGAIMGATGCGKTFGALRLATGLLHGTGKRIAVADTENRSASLYADLTASQCERMKVPAPFDFDVMDIRPPFESEEFRKAVRLSVEGGYGALIIDSASHLWKGLLEFKDRIDARAGVNQFSSWKDVDKKFDPALMDILQSQIHIIFCMRSKMEYILEDDGKGKKVPRKVGMAPVMRPEIEYEFTTIFDVGFNHDAVATKDRSGLFDGKVFQITEESGKEIAGWLSTAKPDGFNGIKWEGVTVKKYTELPEPEKQRTWYVYEFSNDFKAYTLSASLANKIKGIGEGMMDVKTRPVKERFEVIDVEYVPQ